MDDAGVDRRGRGAAGSGADRLSGAVVVRRESRGGEDRFLEEFPWGVEDSGEHARRVREHHDAVVEGDRRDPVGRDDAVARHLDDERSARLRTRASPERRDDVRNGEERAVFRRRNRNGAARGGEDDCRRLGGDDREQKRQNLSEKHIAF